MKKIYSIVFFILSIITSANAAPVINGITNNGAWSTNSTWNLNRQPVHADTIVIPAGYTIIVATNINLTSDDVYIKVYGVLKFTNGKLRLGANSVVKVMAGASIVSIGGNNNDKIEIGGVPKFLGSDLIISGPAIANSATGVSPSGFAISGSPLPVKLLSFNVARQQNNNIIEWFTAQEINSDFFEIQRSENGSTWTTIATVKAAGNSSSVISYSFTDRTNVASKVYYRLRQVDIDGRSDFSVVRMIKNENISADVKISNGYSNNILVHFSSQVKGAVSVKLISLQGNVVNQSIISNPVGQQILSVKENLKGLFVVAVIDQNGNKYSSQILL